MARSGGIHNLASYIVIKNFRELLLEVFDSVLPVSDENSGITGNVERKIDKFLL